MSIHANRQSHFIGELLGLPAIFAAGAVLWWQWKNVHMVSLQFFMWLDRSLSLSILPPLVVYALSGAILTASFVLLKHDRQVIGGIMGWRAMLVPVILGMILHSLP